MLFGFSEPTSYCSFLSST